MPMMADATLGSLELLERSLTLMGQKCVSGIRADEERCSQSVQWSLAMATPLSARLGYDRAAQIAQKAYHEGRTVRELVVTEGLLSEGEADEILDPYRMLGPETS